MNECQRSCIHGPNSGSSWRHCTHTEVRFPTINHLETIQYIVIYYCFRILCPHVGSSNTKSTSHSDSFVMCTLQIDYLSLLWLVFSELFYLFLLVVLLLFTDNCYEPDSNRNMRIYGKTTDNNINNLPYDTLMRCDCSHISYIVHLTQTRELQKYQLPTNRPDDREQPSTSQSLILLKVKYLV